MSAPPPLPELSDELTLAQKLRYRRLQLDSVAGLIALAQEEGTDLSWVPDAAVQFLRAAAASIEQWSAEIEAATQPTERRGRQQG